MLTHGANTEQKRGSVPALYAANPMNAPGARCTLPEVLERMDEGQQRTRLDVAAVPMGRSCAGGERFRAEQPYPMCLLHLGHCSPASARQAAAGGLGRAFPSFDGSLGTGTGRQ